MTINGGKPHAVGYQGQRYKITVAEEGRKERRIVGWSAKPAAGILLDSLETRPGWSDARCEPVVNKKTGDATPS
jgi:hypothetical protein